MSLFLGFSLSHSLFSFFQWSFVSSSSSSSSSFFKGPSDSVFWGVNLCFLPQLILLLLLVLLLFLLLLLFRVIVREIKRQKTRTCPLHQQPQQHVQVQLYVKQVEENETGAHRCNGSQQNDVILLPDAHNGGKMASPTDGHGTGRTRRRRRRTGGGLEGKPVDFNDHRRRRPPKRRNEKREKERKVKTTIRTEFCILYFKGWEKRGGDREKEMICIRYVGIFYEPNRCSTDGRIRSPPPRGLFFFFVFVFFVLPLYFLFLYPRHEKFDCWLRSSSSSSSSSS